MGKRGPKPKSNEMKRLEGNPGQRKLVDPSPEEDPTEGALTLPMRLNGDGRRIWKEVLASFPSWYFTAADRPLLIRYCTNLSRLEAEERAMKREGSITKRGNGATCVNPRLKLIQDLESQVFRLSEMLHLTRDKRKGMGMARDPGELPAASRQTPAEDSVPVGAVVEDEFGDLLAPPVH